MLQRLLVSMCFLKYVITETYRGYQTPCSSDGRPWSSRYTDVSTVKHLHYVYIS